jgi:hypothetical protein
MMAGQPEELTTTVLEQRLADLAADWRIGTPDDREVLAATYAETLNVLYVHGWDDLLDGEGMIPNEMMPADYFVRYPEAGPSNWSVSLSWPFGRN